MKGETLNKSVDDLKQERDAIYEWMNKTTHPSQIVVWSDYASNLSRQWTVKETRLHEILDILKKQPK